MRADDKGFKDRSQEYAQALNDVEKIVGTGREAEALRCAELLDRAEEVLGAAGDAPGPVPAELDEAERRLAALLAAPVDSGEQRSLLESVVWAARLRYAYEQSPRSLDTVIERLDALRALTAAEAVDHADAGPGSPGEALRADLTDIVCDLAFDLADRCYRSEPGEARAADADRVVELLGSALAGPDSRLVPDPTRCRAVLGLVLSGRCRGPEHDTPERLADRRAAVGHLRTALGADDLDPALRPAVAFDLALLSYLELGDRIDSGTGPDPDGVVSEVVLLLEVLRPHLADDGPDGAEAAELGCDICDFLLDRSSSALAQGTAAEWFRGTLAHPALGREAFLDTQRRLGLVLALRSEENRVAQRPGDPVPAADRAEAVVLLEEMLSGRWGAAADPGAAAGTEPGSADEDFLACLTAIVNLRWLDLSDRVLDDDGIDRLVARVRQLTAVIGPDDTDRAEMVLKAGITLTERAVDRAQPHSYELSNVAVGTGRSDPALAVERIAPKAVADLREAADLLRTGAGLYPHDDELRLGACVLLGTALMLDFACGLPVARRPLLREALRYLRVAMERLPARSALRDDDLHGAFLGCLMYQVWYTEPFARARDEHGGPGVPDVSGFAQVEDDLQLLASMLDPETLEKEPVFVLVGMTVDVLRSPGELPSAADSLDWARRLRTAAVRVEPRAQGLRAVMLAFAGVLGLRAAQAGPVTREERAATVRDLRGALDLLPYGSPMRGPLSRALLEEEAGDARDLIRTLFQGLTGRGGTGPATGTGPDRPAHHHPGSAGQGTAHAGSARIGATGKGPAWVWTGNTGTAPDRAPRVQARPPGEWAVESPPVLDPAATVLLGDGSPDPFALPTGRVAELLGGASPAEGPVQAAARALLHYHQWLRERDEHDLTTAVALVRQARTALDDTSAPDAGGPLSGAPAAPSVRTTAPRSPAAADRCAEFLARLLLDRHLLLGDRSDLDAAVQVYEALLPRVSRHTVHPPLAALLASAGDPRVPARVFRPLGDGPPSPFRAELLAGLGTARLLLAGARRRDAEVSAAGALEDLGTARRDLPPDHPRLPAVRTELAWHALRQARAGQDPDAERTAVDELLRIAASCPASSPHRPAILLRTAATLCGPDAGTGEGPDAGRLRKLDEAVALLRQAAEESAHEFHGSRSRCLYGLGVLLLTRHRRTARADDLRDAVAALREARLVLNATPGDPFAVVLIRALALAHRVHGPDDREHRRASRETARSALSAHGRSVLLQSGAGHGLEAARAVADDMLRLVRWSLADGLPGTAFEALELGRGLVLNAATVAVTVPELLRDAGHPGLADRWEAAAGDREDAVPDGLRRLVLEAFAGGAAEKRLLAAPGPARVAEALRRLDSDALVYLVPGEGRAPGHAVAVTSAGDVHALPLPGLTALGQGPLDVYARSLRAFQDANREESRPAPRHPRVMHEKYRRTLLRLEQEWHLALDGLCSWAGETVMAPLLAAADGWWPGRTARLVLAPVGALGIVPWHAARCPVPSAGGLPPGRKGPVYACERAVLSSCASARQLVEVADRTRAEVGEGRVAVVVAPDGSRTMHREAALVAARHPEVTVIGGMGRETPPDGRAAGAAPLPPLPASLAPYLPGHSAVPTALLHVNCHAEAGPSPADSVLKLDATHRVSVADILAGAAHRDPGVPGGTVVLANCTSDLTVDDHDEVLTLATAFLGAGATAVIGSRWAITDDPRTTLLMLLLHHHLGRGVPPRDALRAAQLWMLAPDRTLPPELAGHEDLLGDQTRRPPDELEVWASFAHHGR
ncbi:CHAT domain-containing protein [Streptomyces solaniscabiei]|uniref:CHAT domain-containing protein n=1 Tax=Streptomyces solaniscabiei TaxID=2683255 RepID=UPI001CE3792E|nr:CHAT domain-containing protein [Streptomyces solaniscabiei]